MAFPGRRAGADPKASFNSSHAAPKNCPSVSLQRPVTFTGMNPHFSSSCQVRYRFESFVHHRLQVFEAASVTRLDGQSLHDGGDEA